MNLVGNSRDLSQELKLVAWAEVIARMKEIDPDRFYEETKNVGVGK